MTNNATFWSYKGGVGRTIALVNTAFQLAKLGKRVLIWEMDLDAPGLLRIPVFQAVAPKVKSGTVELLANASRDLDNIRAQVREAVVEFEDTGSNPVKMHILAAGKPGDGYAARYSAIDWGRFFGPDTKLGYHFFEAIQYCLAEIFQPDFMLIDSRTGLTDIAGICTVHLPDTVVLVHNLSEQGVDGMARVQRALEERNRDTRKRPLRILRLASHVPASIPNEVERRMAELRSQGLEPHVRVQLQEALLVTESIVSRDAPGDPNSLQFARLVGLLDDPYRDWLREATRWVQLRGTVGARKFELDHVYARLYAHMGSGPAPLEQLRQHRLVIEGDPGSGKTTALRWMARLLEREGRYPLLIRVADLDAPIPRHLAGQGWGLDEAYFEEKLRSPETVVLLDGLDEAGDARQRRSVAMLVEQAALLYPHCRIVATTRPGSPLPGGFDRVRIEGLDDQAVNRLLEALAGERWREIRAAIDERPEILAMARNPLMLTALTAVHQEGARLPDRRADLYQAILEWLAKARELKPGRASAEDCLSLLRKLALGMQAGKAGRATRIERGAAADLLGDVAGDQALEFLAAEEVDSGIVVSVGVELRFWHLTFQEYLAARELAGLPDARQRRELLRDARVFRPEWRETALLLEGILLSTQGRGKAEALVEAVAKAAGRTFAGKVRCVALLGAMSSAASSPAFLKLARAMTKLFEPGSEGIEQDSRVLAAEALGVVGDPRLRTPLDDDYWITFPKGRFRMGDNREADLGAFRLGRYPVTVWEYRKYIDQGGGKPAEWDRQSKYANRPVVYVTWRDCQRYCEWAVCRMPREAEWERAVRGKKGRSYPWGESRPDAMRVREGTPACPAPVGLFPMGNSPEGVADLIGCVGQWTLDGVVRGAGTGDVAARSQFDSGHPLVGFRCAVDWPHKRDDPRRSRV